MADASVAPRRAPALSMQHYRKTQEGMELIASGEPFLLGGEIFQGYNLVAVTVHERQLTDAELEKATDVDGMSRAKIMATRRGRLGAAQSAREREQEERNQKLRAKRRDELELQKLERELDPGPPVPIADMEAAVACAECGKEFPNARQLQGHMMGAHRKPKE